MDGQSAAAWADRQWILAPFGNGGRKGGFVHTSLAHSGFVGKAADSDPFHIPPYDPGLMGTELSPSETSPEQRPSAWAVLLFSLEKFGVMLC